MKQKMLFFLVLLALLLSACGEKKAPTQPLAFRLNWPSSSIVAPRTAELLAESWKQIGIKIEPQAVEDDALTAQCCPALDYDIMIWGWVADPDPDTLLIIPTTDQIVTGYNETGYSNPRYDELYAAQGVELDKAKRKEMVWEMQKIVHEDIVYIIPFYAQQVQAYRTDRFEGWLDSETKLALEDVTSIMKIKQVGGGSGGTVRIGWSNGPDSLNPGVAWLSEAYTIYELVYDSMYDLNLDGTFSLSVADSVERSEDGLTYTFKIKKGIKWHDGEPFTAKDIAFTYNLYKAHDDFPTLNSYTEHFVSAEATDDTTLILTLDAAIPNLESKLVFLYLLPEHIWKDHAEGTTAAEFENKEMIGTGPFKLAEQVPNEFMRLVANQEYYAGRANVDEVVFQVFASPDVLAQAIKSGQMDMVTELASTAVASLEQAENVKVVKGAPFAPDLTDIILNQVLPENCPTKEEGGICSGHPALRDKQVRLAMAHAVDKQKLIDVVMLGLATPGIALIPEGTGEWFNSSIQDYPFDIAKANDILDAAGYLDTDGDGVREMPAP